MRVISSPSIFYLVRGIEIFNVSPMVGLTYFFAFGVIDNDPWELAKFLSKQKEISRKSIGKLLGNDAVEELRS